MRRPAGSLCAISVLFHSSTLYEIIASSAREHLNPKTQSEMEVATGTTPSDLLDLISSRTVWCSICTENSIYLTRVHTTTHIHM